MVWVCGDYTSTDKETNNRSYWRWHIAIVQLRNILWTRSLTLEATCVNITNFDWLVLKLFMYYTMMLLFQYFIDTILMGVLCITGWYTHLILSTVTTNVNYWLLLKLSFSRHFCNFCSIDATFSRQLGRYVNDGIFKEQNGKVRVVLDSAGKPHLCIFASKNIEKGDEIRFDYGVKNLPWRKKCMYTLLFIRYVRHLEYKQASLFDIWQYKVIYMYSNLQTKCIFFYLYSNWYLFKYLAN